MFDMQILMYFVLAVIIIAIVLIVIAAIIERWLAYDLRIVPKIGAIPADGMARLPVRIEVYNGFRRPKKMRSDTYVELEATSGRIESVTIPSGRSFADAVLTSSKEFGAVTVKAKLGDKSTASVPVEFKLEGGSLAITITPGVLIADRKSTASINIRIRNSKGNYVVPLSDKVIELNTTMGEIVGTVISMPARANSANATIVSGGDGGIAMVTASMGALKGTGRVEFRGMSRKLCANCGEPIPGNLPACPSCGTMVSSGEKSVEASTT
jgi:rRNA maturation endonuclease Nob1